MGRLLLWRYCILKKMTWEIQWKDPGHFPQQSAYSISLPLACGVASHVLTPYYCVNYILLSDLLTTEWPTYYRVTYLQLSDLLTTEWPTYYCYYWWTHMYWVMCYWVTSLRLSHDMSCSLLYWHHYMWHTSGDILKYKEYVASITVLEI